MLKQALWGVALMVAVCLVAGTSVATAGDSDGVVTLSDPPNVSTENGVLDELTMDAWPLGDLNCDGLVNTFDIDPFVQALTDPAGYRAAFPNCDVLNADCNEDGFVNTFDIDAFAFLLSCAPALSVGSTLPESVVVTWQWSCSDPAAFEVSKSGDGVVWDAPATLSGGSRSATIQGLQCATTYWIRLRAVRGGGGHSRYSNVLAVLTPSAPVAPANFHVGDVGPTGVTVYWDCTGSWADNVLVFQSTNHGHSWSPGVPVAPAAGRYRVESLTPGTEYCFRACAQHTCGGRTYSSGYTPTVCATTLTCGPAPYGLELRNLWPETLDLGWRYDGGDPAGFIIEISQDGQAWRTCTTATIHIPERSARVRELTCETQYWFRVRANIAGCGLSEPSNVIYVTTPRPEAPYGLEVRNLWPETLDLGWYYDGPDPDGFIVEMRRDGGDWETCPTATVHVPERSARVRDLVCGARYWFRVRAYLEGCGPSDPSNVVEVTMPSTPPAPTDFHISNLAPTSLDLCWHYDVSWADYIRFAKSTDGGRTWNNIGQVEALPGDWCFHVDELTAHREYCFRIRAQHTCNGEALYSEYTPTICVRTP